MLSFSANQKSVNFSYTLLQLQQKITFSPRDFHCTRQALVMRNWNITLLYFVYFFQEDKSKKDSSKVKKLYHELNLKQVFKDYEEESYKNIVELISQKSGNLPEGLFLEFVKKIYKRNKWAIVLQTRFIIIERPLHCHFDWQ